MTLYITLFQQHKNREFTVFFSSCGFHSVWQLLPYHGRGFLVSIDVRNDSRNGSKCCPRWNTGEMDNLLLQVLLAMTPKRLHLLEVLDVQYKKNPPSSNRVLGRTIIWPWALWRSRSWVTASCYGLCMCNIKIILQVVLGQTRVWPFSVDQGHGSRQVMPHKDSSTHAGYNIKRILWAVTEFWAG